MIITVGDAKQKWCPFNKDQDYDHGVSGRCKATDCLMWRFWVDPFGVNKQHGEKRHGIANDKKLGYCGLSGPY